MEDSVLVLWKFDIRFYSEIESGPSLAQVATLPTIPADECYSNVSPLSYLIQPNLPTVEFSIADFTDLFENFWDFNWISGTLRMRDLLWFK